MSTAKVTVLYPGPEFGAQASDQTSLQLDDVAEPGAGAVVLALSADDEFVQSVGDALEEGRQLRWVTNAREILAASQSGPAALVVDAAVGLSQLPHFISKLKKARSQLAIIIAGERADSSDLIKLVSSGQVFRLLFKPLAPGLTRLAIEAALQRQLHPEPAVEELEPDFGPAPFGSSGFGSSLGIPQHWRRWVVIAAVLGVAIWWLGGDEEPVPVRSPERPAETLIQARPEPEPVPAPAPPPAAAPSLVDQLLAQAQAAFEAGNYASPNGPSALAYYLDVLRIEPDNAAARDGVARIAAVMLTRAEQALLAERVDVAQAALAVARELQSDSARLAFLEAQVLEAEQSTLIAQAYAAANRGDVEGAAAILDHASLSGAAESEELTLVHEKIADLQTQKWIETALERANQRLSEGRLVQPTEDSAKFHFNSVLGVDADNSASLEGMRSVADQLIDRARQSISKGDLTAAKRWLDEAGQVGIDVPALASAGKELSAASARRKEEARRQANLKLLNLGRQRLDEGRLVAPEGDSAKHYLLAFRETEPGNSDLRASLEGLNAQLARRASQAIAAEEFDTAQGWIDEALELAVREDVVRSLQSELDVAREIAVLKPRVVEGMLVRTEFSPPRYPRKAHLMGIEGRVRVDFTVSVDGEVKDFVVAESEPEGVFDRAALRALEKWSYEPTVVGGKAIERRAYVVFKFELED